MKGKERRWYKRYATKLFEVHSGELLGMLLLKVSRKKCGESSYEDEHEACHFHKYAVLLRVRVRVSFGRLRC